MNSHRKPNSLCEMPCAAAHFPALTAWRRHLPQGRQTRRPCGRWLPPSPNRARPHQDDATEPWPIRRSLCWLPELAPRGAPAPSAALRAIRQNDRQLKHMILGSTAHLHARAQKADRQPAGGIRRQILSLALWERAGVRVWNRIHAIPPGWVWPPVSLRPRVGKILGGRLSVKGELYGL